MSFLDLRRYNLSHPVLELCQKAQEILIAKNDMAHGEMHIASILERLDRFLKDEAEVLKAVDLNVLVCSIVWHDIWRSQREPRNWLDLLYNELNDGLGSAKIFSKYAKAIKLEKGTLKKIAYTIRKHSSFQLFPRATLEAKILFDLDEIDKFSVTRLRKIEETHMKPGTFGKTQIKAAKFFFDKFMKNVKPKTMHFEWTRNEFEKCKSEMISEVNKLFIKYQNYLK